MLGKVGIVAQFGSSVRNKKFRRIYKRVAQRALRLLSTMGHHRVRATGIALLLFVSAWAAEQIVQSARRAAATARRRAASRLHGERRELRWQSRSGDRVNFGLSPLILLAAPWLQFSPDSPSRYCLRRTYLLHGRQFWIELLQ